MSTTAAVYSDTTHGRFIRHMDLARLWCQYNGKKGTEKQVLRIKNYLAADVLERMLRERGVTL